MIHASLSPRHLSYLAILLLFSVAVPTTVAAESSHAKHEDVPFLETPERTLKLDLFVPQGVENPPLVVYIHGGSWRAGNHKNPPIRWLVDRGFAVASISYRFSTEAIFPAQIQDCMSAIRWLRAHGGEHGYDATRIGVVGTSAGGQLALLLGVNSASPEHRGTLGDHANESTEVAAVVSFHGASDFLLRAQTQPARTNPPDSVVHRLLGAAPGDDPEQARLASAAFHVHDGSAPLLMIHGTEDTTVLPDQSERMAEAYREGGRPVEFILVEGGKHNLGTVLNDETRAAINAFFDKHLRE